MTASVARRSVSYLNSRQRLANWLKSVFNESGTNARIVQSARDSSGATGFCARRRVLKAVKPSFESCLASNSFSIEASRLLTNRDASPCGILPIATNEFFAPGSSVSVFLISAIGSGCAMFSGAMSFE